MGWKRLKEEENTVILGHWENDETCSMITLTKGLAHIVHDGRAGVLATPEETYSDNVETIGRMIAKMLSPRPVVS
jgi:hypothetical protein